MLIAFLQVFTIGAIFIGLVLALVYHRRMDEVDRAPLFDAIAFGEAMSGFVIGVILVIAGIIGAIVWACLA